MLFKNIIGDTKDTIDAIQRYIERNNKEQAMEKAEELSINRVIASVQDESVMQDINKIIKGL